MQSVCAYNSLLAFCSQYEAEVPIASLPRSICPKLKESFPSWEDVVLSVQDFNPCGVV